MPKIKHLNPILAHLSPKPPQDLTNLPLSTTFAPMNILAFLASLAVILIISRRSLALGIIAGALVLGVVTLPFRTFLDRLVFTLTDYKILAMSIAVGIIPLIGGAMKKSGQIDSLVENVRIRQKHMLAFAPALMGLLPMPGGALLSAPIMERSGHGVPDDIVAAANNWFRHMFLFIYPLAPALIVLTAITALDLYLCILYVLPFTVVATVMGYLFFLRKVDGDIIRKNGFSLKGLLVPLSVILSAPLLDFILKKFFGLSNTATLIGVITGLTLSLLFNRAKLPLLSLFKEMKPWNFALIILGMFLYLHIFEKTDIGQSIAELPLPPLLLAITAGFALGFLTGRVHLPGSIVFPVYLTGVGHITPYVFALIYIAIYFGYINSPVHPCLVVTCEYFHISIRDMLKKLAIPTAIIMALIILLALIID